MGKKKVYNSKCFCQCETFALSSSLLCHFSSNNLLCALDIFQITNSSESSGDKRKRTDDDKLKAPANKKKKTNSKKNRSQEKYSYHHQCRHGYYCLALNPQPTPLLQFFILFFLSPFFSDLTSNHHLSPQKKEKISPFFILCTYTCHIIFHP